MSSYVWEYKDLLNVRSKGDFMAQFEGAEMALIRFRTDPAVIAEVLPRPLRTPEEPLGTAFVARYPRTNFGLSYAEGALFVDASYKGEVGSYCLSMPVDDDMAMVAGRETYGYPKKIADRIMLDVVDDHLVGSVVRKDFEILRVEGDLDVDGALPAPELGTPVLDLEGRPCSKGISWLFKYFPAAWGNGYESAPLLVREPVLFRPRGAVRPGNLDLKLVSSPTDPLGDIPVLDIVAGGYGVFDNTMLPGRAVRKVRNPYAFARKAMFKFDVYSLIDLDAMPSLSFRERRRLRRAIRAY